MKNRLLIIIGIIVATSVVLLFPYVVTMVNHTGLSVTIVINKELLELIEDHGAEIPNVTEKDLQKFPALLTMFNLLLEAQENEDGDTKTVFINFNSYRIYYNDNDQEYRVKNYMSDNESDELFLKIHEHFNSNVIKYKDSHFMINNWIS